MPRFTCGPGAAPAFSSSETTSILPFSTATVSAESPPCLKTVRNV
ncbi:hypothetical protein GBAR_LOCUS13947, partial [Geodia barretti]